MGQLIQLKTPSQKDREAKTWRRWLQPGKQVRIGDAFNISLRHDRIVDAQGELIEYHHKLVLHSTHPRPAVPFICNTVNLPEHGLVIRLLAQHEDAEQRPTASLVEIRRSHYTSTNGVLY